MRDEYFVGSCPVEEECVQVTRGSYVEVMRQEVQAYKRALVRLHGEPPPGARLRVRAQSHDFGTYYEVVCEVNDAEPEAELEAALEYARKCDEAPPDTWADAGLRVRWTREGENYSGFVCEELEEWTPKAWSELCE